jgi:pimeloyl-ACP methyl ester carboxylesterase
VTENLRQIFDADVRDISYLDEGTGPAIVLLPEAGLDFAYFGALASILVEEDFRVVRIATRRSTATTLHELAQDVVDVLEHLGISEAWIGGHGFGGAVARTVAIDHHERVSGVLLLGVTRDAPYGEDFDAEVRAVFGDSFSPQADVRRCRRTRSRRRLPRRGSPSRTPRPSSSSRDRGSRHAGRSRRGTT